MPSVPPTGGNPPSSHSMEPDKSSSKSDNTPAPPATSGSGGDGMTAFMATFTPEQRKKLMDLFVQNFARQIQKDSQKVVEQLKKERQKIQGGGDD